MAQIIDDSSKLYTVTRELVTIGRKHITVRCPRTMTAMLQSGLQLTPVAEYFKRSKDESDPKNVITFFNIRLLDKFYRPAAGESSKTYDVQIELPANFSDCVSYDTALSKVNVALARPDIQQFFADLDEMLMCWFPVMSAKRDDPTTPLTFHRLSNSSVSLKYPWKKVPLQEYASTFNSENQVHMLALGVGYHNLKNSEVGISVQLSQFPSLTYRGMQLQRHEQNERAAKKRKVVALDAEGKEVEERPVIAIGVFGGESQDPSGVVIPCSSSS